VKVLVVDEEGQKIDFCDLWALFLTPNSSYFRVSSACRARLSVARELPSSLLVHFLRAVNVDLLPTAKNPVAEDEEQPASTMMRGDCCLVVVVAAAVLVVANIIWGER